MVIQMIRVVFQRFTIVATMTFIVARLYAGDISGTVKVLGGKGIEHTLVYIEKVEGKTFSPLQKNPVIDQMRMTFVPHVLPVLAGSTVDFPNSDSVRHNVFSPSKTKKFNLGTYPAGVTKKVPFDKTGVVSLLCNVHPEMSAYIVVLQNPYYTLVGKTGKYKIKNIPAGTYTLVVWHPKFKVKRITVEVSQDESRNMDVFLDE